MSKRTVHVVWNISHPADVPMDEYASYDVVCVASAKQARRVECAIGRQVHELLQCTDAGVFRPLAPAAERRGTVFVGNTRSVQRDLVLWALELGVDARIWGAGWSHFIDTSYVQAQSLGNDEVGALYGSSRIVLNDHWPDMRESGFINNRVFDALGAGALLISDRHESLEELFPNDVLYAGTKDELEDALERSTLAYPTLSGRVAKRRELVVRDFSFDARAKHLVSLAEAAVGKPLPGLRASAESSTRGGVPSESSEEPV